MKGFLAAGFLMLILSGTPIATNTPAHNPTITPVEMPDTGHAGEAFLARTPEGTTMASWIERHGQSARMVVARRLDTGWSEPLEIARGDNWFVNWADVPSVAVHESGTMIAHWLERLGDERYAYGVRFALSDDDGLTWSHPAWLHEDRSPTEHGFARILPYSNGFLAVWLDGNAYATERREMAIHARMVSLDGVPGREMVIDPRTCDCCPTELVALPDGRLATIYRDRSDGELRDMSFSVFDGGEWSEPRTLHEDGWQINACPVNGPAADTSGDAIATAWFTMASGSSEVWAGFVPADDFSMMTDPIRVDNGRPAGRVAVRMDGPETAVVLWMEGGSEDQAGLFVRKVHRDGTMGEAFRVAFTSTGRTVGYPRLERDAEGWLAVWTQPGAEPDTPSRLKAVHINFDAD